MREIWCNKYEVLRPVAEGGMGSVFLVKDLHLNKLAAVKVSRCDPTRRTKAAVLKERELLKELSHPALPVILDFFEEGDRACMVMEYVEGITLEQYLRQFGRVEEKQAVKWAITLTEALGYLHSRKPAIIYQDLKPANIIIKPEGELKLVDFGAAFVSLHGQLRQCQPMGTPEYGAPEQFSGGEIGREADIFGLGAVLHEMLTGVPPAGPDRVRRPIRFYDRSLPAELEKLIQCCLRKRPEERYHSMGQVREALSSYGRRGLPRRLFFRGLDLTGLLLAGGGAVSMLLALQKGIREEQFPFPALSLPCLLLGAALCCRLLLRLVRGSRGRGYKLGKSLFLTEKKFSGLYLSLWQLFLLTTVALLSFSMPGTGRQAAAAEEKQLKVELRDTQNRKLLLKDGCILQTRERVRLDVPAETLPSGELALQVIAVSESGEYYSSRVFLVEGVSGESQGETTE